MKTKRQEEWVASYLAALGDETRSLYQDIIRVLSDLGYHPSKDRSNLSFKHDLHNKQIVKIGMKKNPEKSPFFALRFSACRNYSQRFADIVSAAIVNYPARAARCIDHGCNFCRGEADTHVYACEFPDGERKTHCGAYALEIPNITPDDFEEIQKLIQEEHAYLLEQEAGLTQ